MERVERVSEDPTISAQQQVQMHEQHLRQSALEMAVRTHEVKGMESSPSAILETARLYEDFMFYPPKN